MLLLGALSAYCSGSACLHMEQMDADVRFVSCDTPQASSALPSSALRCHFFCSSPPTPPLPQQPLIPRHSTTQLPSSSRSVLRPCPSSYPPSLPLLLSSLLAPPPILPPSTDPSSASSTHTPYSPPTLPPSTLETGYLRSGIAQNCLCFCFSFCSVAIFVILPSSWMPFLYDAKPVDAQETRNRKSREIEAEKSGSQEAEKPGSGTTSSVAETNETAYS